MLHLDSIAAEAGNKFVTITFIKKDGSERTINGRFGVKKYLNGGKSTLDPEKYLTIYSLADEGYRAINRETILRVAIGGVVVFKKGIV